MKQIIIKLISFYQVFLSFDTGILRFLTPNGACIHSVRCSEYTKQMIKEFGVVKGIKIGFCRIIRCNRLFEWIPPSFDCTQDRSRGLHKGNYV